MNGHPNQATVLNASEPVVNGVVGMLWRVIFCLQVRKNRRVVGRTQMFAASVFAMCVCMPFRVCVRDVVAWSVRLCCGWEVYV